MNRFKPSGLNILINDRKEYLTQQDKVVGTKELKYYVKFLEAVFKMQRREKKKWEEFNKKLNIKKLRLIKIKQK